MYVWNVYPTVAVLNVFIKLMENLDIFSYILNVSIENKTFSCTKYNWMLQISNTKELLFTPYRIIDQYYKMQTLWA